MRTTLVLLAMLLAAAPAAAAPVITVDAGRPGVQTSAAVAGTSQPFTDGDGEPPAVWDAQARAPDPAAVEAARLAGVKLLGFPGGAEGGRYSFRAGIGRTRTPCQYAGTPSDEPQSNVYGFDEHMELAAAIGAEAQVTIPFAFMTAGAAADWVEYANAEVGTNPRGGIAWAQLRADNGHPAPYAIERWEIGAGPRQRSRRHWLARDDRRARRQYARGGVFRGVRDRADGLCTWSPLSSGTPLQRFRTRYAPVRPGSVELRVGGDDRAWRPVDRLARPGGRIFALEGRTGDITFGNGSNGVVPPAGAPIVTTYETKRLPGYEDFRAAMRAVDPSIDVCASWDDAAFLRDARRAGRRLDCLTTRPYTNLARFGGLLFNAAAYDAALKGAATAARRLTRLRAGLRRLPGRPYLAVADAAAVAGRARVEPSFGGSMIQAVYGATQQMTWLRAGLPWALTGRLLDDPAALLRDPERLAPAGEVQRVFGDLAGRRLVRARVTGNPVRQGYAALRAVATRTQTGLTVVVLNRSRELPVSARLDLAGFVPSRPATQIQLTAPAFDSAEATVGQGPADVASGTVLQLPPHSLTRLDLG